MILWISAGVSFIFSAPVAGHVALASTRLVAETMSKDKAPIGDMGRLVLADLDRAERDGRKDLASILSQTEPLSAAYASIAYGLYRGRRLRSRRNDDPDRRDDVAAISYLADAQDLEHGHGRSDVSPTSELIVQRDQSGWTVVC